MSNLCAKLSRGTGLLKCGIGVLSEQNDIALEYNYMIISNVQIFYTIIRGKRGIKVRCLV